MASAVSRSICWLVFIAVSSTICFAQANSPYSYYASYELSRNITHILNTLVDKKYYDKRLRPNYGGPAVDVGITLHVSSISAVSEVDMDYTLDFYLRQNWVDPRLDIRRLGAQQQLTVGWEYTKDIWVPDTFFPNEKKSFFHQATTHNSFLRIKGKGEILTSHRLTVTPACPMALHLFPLDSQECTLEIESYGYSAADTKYRWLGNQPITMDEVSLPQFYVAHFSVRDRTITLTTGDYSRLNVKFVFVRNIGFYLMQIYIPSMLIVIISWVSFWIHRDASPARVALGVTTVLTMTTLMTTTNASLPKVSYIKAIDIYLGTSFVMVFASLLEYAAVSYLNKKMKMKRERKKQKDAQSQEFPIMPNQPPRRPMSGAAEASFYPYISNKAQRDYQRLVAGNLSPPMAGSHFECECDVNFQPIPLKITKPRLRRRKLHNVTPSSIDKYSRMMFPIIFAVFNVIYWISCFFVSRKHLEKKLSEQFS